MEFRRQTLLPLNHVLGCLRETIPKLSRSALHRCLERPSALPDCSGDLVAGSGPGGGKPTWQVKTETSSLRLADANICKRG